MSAKLFAIAGGIALSFGLAATTYFALAPREEAFAQCRTTVVAGGAGAIGGPFELVTHEGDVATPETVFTQPSLVYFGFTQCPDFCPMDLGRNAIAVDLLTERGLEVTPVFVTIDPERDTVEALAEYVPYVHPEMIGLTGSSEAVRGAVSAYAVYAVKQGEGEDYVYDHSTFSYLMGPDGTFWEFFQRDLSPEALADRVACFVEAAPRA